MFAKTVAKVKDNKEIIVGATFLLAYTAAASLLAYAAGSLVGWGAGKVLDAILTSDIGEQN